MASKIGRGAGDSRLADPAWCVGGDGPHKEHFSDVVRVDGSPALLVELAMDPEEDQAPHVTILPERDGLGLRLGVAQALELSRVLERVVAPAWRSAA